MPKPVARAYARHSLEAIEMLGHLIRIARKEKRLTAQELATRAGISRALLHRIETGDPGCAIGAVFEAASIVGVPLFSPERAELGERLGTAREKLSLLPKSVRRPEKAVKDDF